MGLSRAFLLCVFLIVGSSAAETLARPNVLFIAIDDLNDWLGCLHGHPQAVTPNIDRLAERGVLFANAHCQAPLCNPSRASIFTGLRPSTTGIYALDPSFRVAPLTAQAVTIPQHLAAQGYRTYTSGKVYHDSKDVADILKKDFQVVGSRAHTSLPATRFVAAPTAEKGVDWGVFPPDDHEQGDWKTIDVALEHLRSAPVDQPFFITTGLRLPHVPCYVSQRWFDLIPANVSLPPIQVDDRNDVPAMAWFLHWDLPEPRLSWLQQAHQWQPLVRSYLACIAFMDSQVGRLLDGLAADPRASNTLVVLWSDNGWHLGEKGITGKNSLWERSTHVPLIIAGPGVHAGGVCRQPVELLDLYPTLIETCHLPAKPELEGHSLVAQLRDPSAVRAWPAITTANRGNHSIRSARYRYIRYADGSEELYDHDSDPNEWTNLAHNPEYAAMRKEHAAWLPSTEAAPTAGSRARSLVRDGDVWLWEGKPITTENGIPGDVKAAP